MDQSQKIRNVVERAAGLNMAVRPLCERAKVPHATFKRWQKDASGARYDQFESAMKALDNLLTAMERKQLQYLSERLLPRDLQKTIANAIVAPNEKAAA